MRPWTAKLLGALQVVGLLLVSQAVGLCQEKPNPIDWQNGPTVGKLGDIAQLSVPKGYRFTGKSGAQKLLEITQNPSNGQELGALIPVLENKSDIWFVIFEFQDTGYVRDNEKDKLDANAILESIKKGTEASNKVREEKGWPDFHVSGWSRPPYYEPSTHNLTWAILGESQQSGKQLQSVTIPSGCSEGAE